MKGRPGTIPALNRETRRFPWIMMLFSDHSVGRKTRKKERKKPDLPQREETQRAPRGLGTGPAASSCAGAEQGSECALGVSTHACAPAPPLTLVLICLAESVRKMEELGSLALILVWAPCRAGKKVECSRAGFG